MTPADQHAIEDAQHALVFIDCAAWLLGNDATTEGPTRFSADLQVLRPTSFLVGHAIEISLGAFLRAMKAHGPRSNHDLSARLDAAMSMGLTVTEEFGRLVRAMSPSHKNHQFRYAKGLPEAFVMPRYLIPVVRPELEMIRDRVFTLLK